MGQLVPRLHQVPEVASQAASKEPSALRSKEAFAGRPGWLR